MLVFEIGVEEMPASAVEAGIKQLQELAEVKLKSNHLNFESIKVYGTPRRLALTVEGLEPLQAETVQEIKGPPKSVAFDEFGQPTAAAKGFAHAQQVKVSDLVVKTVDNKEYCFAVKHIRGRQTVEVLPQILKELLSSLQFGKSMHWDLPELRFIRPVRWLLALYNNQIINFNVGPLQAANITFGHRFLVPEKITVANASKYKTQVEAALVLLDQDKRRDTIIKELKLAAQKVKGTPVINPAVLNEVIYLVEFPYVVLGRYSSDYLKIPKPVVITAMESHQRYFAVQDSNGQLLPYFLVVHNGDSKYNNLITHGHERVLNARLADATFFFEEDTKTTLASKVDKLKGIIFQEKLGTVYDKMTRIKTLCSWLADQLNLNSKLKEKLNQAAYLCKADLTTQMVVEFPELQGIVGKEYALVDDEDKEVAQALFEHYLPRFAGDVLPQSLTGQLLAIADKIDTISGCFLVGLIPSGSEDPYALRRQGLGLIAICETGKLNLSLKALVKAAFLNYKEYSLTVPNIAEVEETVVAFLTSRLRRYLLDKGYDAEVITSVLAVETDTVPEITKRVDLIQATKGKRELEDIKIAFTRCNNLAQLDLGTEVNPALLKEKEEKYLYEAVLKAEEEVAVSKKQGSYEKILTVLAQLRQPIDNFFDAVLVMAKEPELRANRLKLLNRCLLLSWQFADFTKLS